MKSGLDAMPLFLLDNLLISCYILNSYRNSWRNPIGDVRWFRNNSWRISLTIVACKSNIINSYSINFKRIQSRETRWLWNYLRSFEEFCCSLKTPLNHVFHFAPLIILSIFCIFNFSGRNSVTERRQLNFKISNWHSGQTSTYKRIAVLENPNYARYKSCSPNLMLLKNQFQKGEVGFWHGKLFMNI